MSYIFQKVLTLLCENEKLRRSIESKTTTMIFAAKMAATAVSKGKGGERDGVSPHGIVRWNHKT